MAIENIIQSWKSEEEMDTEFSNPAGEELSDQDLQEISGGMICTSRRYVVELWCSGNSACPACLTLLPG
jgi:bacteriocin-like protein